ncbi:DedA family protein [Methylovirgula sp. 4M-Z18]|uniref:DedA family protein n=1 Tax=Methylovirgula sp. 4M-Z18 TaxID=2293567 RepID=UPI000E2F3668|nr:DedA family protein [Methylovirgula sp. 4M-Z18]RFB80275.1 DedA family protein [Methylovirgula sp. 4M-Z18]
MPAFITDSLLPLIQTHGYWVIFVVVMLESTGVPMPGETALVSAAILAGSTKQLNIELIILCAGAGAILGDNLGYMIGHRWGLPLLVRYGHYVHLDEGRLKLGQYLFLRFGGAIVFFGRFAALLRTFAAMLAGANRYSWRRFLAYNAAGGIVWALLFGLGGYLFGHAIETLSRPIGIAAAAAAILGFLVVLLLMRRFEAQWQEAAERALPGPLSVD